MMTINSFAKTEVVKNKFIPVAEYNECKTELDYAINDLKDCTETCQFEPEWYQKKGVVTAIGASMLLTGFMMGKLLR